MSSPSPKTAPYGSWKSPITSDLIVAQSICAVGRAARRQRHLLAGRTAAGARPQCRRARRRGRATDRRHAAALQRAHARARIWRRIVDGGGWSRLFLQFRRRPLVSTGARRIRAASADTGAARARPRLAVRRRRDRPSPQSLDRRARGPHGRRRAGQHHRRCRSRSVAAASPDACWPAGTISSARRGCRPTATGWCGSPGIIPTCRGTARRCSSPR